MFFPFKSIFPSTETPKNFLVIDLGLEKVTASIFELVDGAPPKMLGVGRKERSKNLQESLEGVLDAVSATSDSLPKKVILGLSGGMMKIVTTIVRYKREETGEEITDKEISEVLEKIDQENHPLKLFFASIISANVDGHKVLNPIGLKGAFVELNFFSSFRNQEEIEFLDNVLANLNFEIFKVLPSAFATTKILLTKGIRDFLILRLAAATTEVTWVKNGGILDIINFSLGEENQDWRIGLEVVIAKYYKEHSLPDFFWIFGEDGDLEKIKESITNFPWSKFNLDKNPKIEVPNFSGDFSAKDLVLLALSYEGGYDANN